MALVTLNPPELLNVLFEDSNTKLPKSHTPPVKMVPIKALNVFFDDSNTKLLPSPTVPKLPLFSTVGYIGGVMGARSTTTLVQLHTE